MDKFRSQSELQAFALCQTRTELVKERVCFKENRNSRETQKENTEILHIKERRSGEFDTKQDILKTGEAW